MADDPPGEDPFLSPLHHDRPGMPATTKPFAATLLPVMAALAANLVVTGCGTYPPEGGVSFEGSDGIGAVLRRFEVPPLDPGAPLLDQAMRRAALTDPAGSLRGITYNLSAGNRLPPGWIVQSPNVWGSAAAAVTYLPPDCDDCDGDFQLPSCRVAADCARGKCVALRASVVKPGQRPASFCLGHSDALIDRFYDLIVTAEKSVDILLLQPAPESRFRAGLRNAITRLAHGGRAVTMRIMIGSHPPEGVDVPGFGRELMRDAGAVSTSRLKLYVGATRSCNGEDTCGAYSWSHAKAIAVDGRAAMVGGHNMWSADYLLDAPVHDLSMQIEGPAARDAHGFADALWRFVCGRPSDDSLNVAYAFEAGAAEPQRGCLPTMAMVPPRPAAGGGQRVLSVGRLAKGIRQDFVDQSLVVQILMFGAARRTIRMVQQDIAFSLVGGVDQQWPGTTIDRMAELIAARGGDVYIVLADFGADGHISDYSNKIPLDLVVRRVRDTVGRQFGIAEPALSALVCRHLHLAPLRFGPDGSWPDRRPIGVHTKMWMVDDRVFYIGSENIYPTELQEFGYILESAAAVRTLRQEFWDKVWTWSRHAAISGAEAPRCVLEAEAPKPK